MTITMIPLSKLVPSPANVRKTGGQTGIEELAASIAAHGLLQNLQVTEGCKGKYEVVAGGRRLAALKLLAKNKTIAKSYAVPCAIADAGEAAEISLAENVVRLPMHPADQYEAFKALADEGKGEEEIAARFGCTPAVVKQRLKLANVSPVLFEVYRADDLTLDQLMAFTVTDDHAAQEAAWNELPEWSRDAAAIRRHLTAAHIEADDPRVKLVTLDAYVQAGGFILRDLFDAEHEGYLTDVGLLDRLVSARLESEAAILRAEGWKWAEIIPELAFEQLRSFQRIEPATQPLPTETQMEIGMLRTEYNALCDTGDEYEEEVADQLETLLQRIEKLEEQASYWPPETLAVAGAIVSVTQDGSVAIHRGLVRPEDRKQARAVENGNSVASSARRENSLSAKLVEDLTAHKTAALRIELARNPKVALVSVLYGMAMDTFYGEHQASCLDISVSEAYLRQSAEGIDETTAAKAYAAELDRWTSRAPQEPDALWGWLCEREVAELVDLLAVLVAPAVNVVSKPHQGITPARQRHAALLEAALGLDMRNWWQPTAASYLGRVAKTAVLEAVKDGVTPEAAENLASLKKDALVSAAEQRLAGQGWLPSILRQPMPPVDSESVDLQEAAE